MGNQRLVYCMETIYSLAIMMSAFRSEVLTFVSLHTISLCMMVIMIQVFEFVTLAESVSNMI